MGSNDISNPYLTGRKPDIEAYLARYDVSFFPNF